MQNGRTALLIAAQSGHLEFVEALLAAGCNKDATDRVRRPPARYDGYIQRPRAAPPAQGKGRLLDSKGVPIATFFV